ncbi:MAG TPA: IS4 family transposase [Chloroflexi bacterium]|nr:IS4 family transposase [Chloroflexota bacterium]
MRVFERLLQPAQATLTAIEEARKQHHNETLAWIDFISVMVDCFTKGWKSMTSLAVALHNADEALKLPPVPVMTRSDAFRRFSPGLCRQALHELITTLPLASNPELTFLGHIYIADGSIFPIVQGLTWTSGSIESAITLHLLFDLKKMVAVDGRIGLEDSSERQALRQKLGAGITYVLDRGYFSFQLIRAVIQAEAHIIVRVYNDIVVETDTELPVDLPKQVSSVWRHVSDRIVVSANPEAESLRFRLVEFSIGDTVYQLITDRLDLNTFEVILLYAYRWQIELIVRFFKHTLNGIQVFPTSPRGVETFFLSLFITALLQLHFKHQCLAEEHILPPSAQEILEAMQEAQSKPSPTGDRPTAHLAIACFMTAVNHNLALFWKIPKHWLSTLADYLHRPFSPDVVAILNKRALSALPRSSIP